MSLPSPARLAAASLALLSAASLAATSAPAPNVAAIIDSLGKVRHLHETAISPDGATLAWTVAGEKGGTEVEIAPMSDPSAAHPVSAAHASRCEENGIAWSPDSKTLAFLSTCADPHQADLFVTTASSSGWSAPRQASHLHGYVDQPAFSPDGKRIGFLYVEGATRPSGALAAMKPPSGVIGVEGLEIQRVAAIDLASGSLTQITPAKLHVYGYDWAPDSHQVAFIAAPPPGENNWWVAQLYTQTLGSPDARSLLDPTRVSGPLHGLQMAVPRWSPDAKQIAFIGGLMSDQGATGGDIYLVPANGGEPTQLTSDQKTPGLTPAWIQWTSPSSMLVSAIREGHSSILSLTTSGPLTSDPDIKLDQLFSGPGLGDGRLELSLSLSSDFRHVAFIQSSYEQAPEVWAGTLPTSGSSNPANSTLPNIHAVTQYNSALKPAWGKSESVQWTDEGFHVQGWLIYPAHYDPAKKYPMIVMVHGGPSSAVLPRWPGVGFGAAPFSAAGYFVLEPNPRGSYGEGEKFTQANRKDFGYGDLRDILAGVDTVTHKLPIDPNRVGLTGWSYGGFMSMFAVTQTQRFKAAVAGAGIANWQSYYGENSIDQWMTPFFGASVYDDPAVYAKSSAINFIHQAKTPTLVVVGDRDGECPAPQSFEFWHALRAQGTPTELVVYPDEGHGFVNPDHRRDVLERALAWFQQYMPGE